MADSGDTKRTALYEQHLSLGGKMVPFAGYEMPLRYDGGVAEHHRVRQDVGLFDVSHMGEVFFRGPDAIAAANHLITNDLNRIKDGRAQYTTMLAEDGTIVDDLIGYRLGPEEILYCVNAANRDTDVAHIRAHLPEGMDVEVTDESDAWTQIAVQGPKAPELLGRLFPEVFPALKPFRVRRQAYQGQEILLATTGYTGEKGAEIYAPNAVGPALWRALLEAGEDLGVGPAGLAARDTLRLEMGYCLYGNDIDRQSSPLEAGLGWVVRMNTEFVGKAALEARGVTKSLVGIEVFERGIPRQGYAIEREGQVIGVVTSGTKSPSTGRCIGLAYVAPEASELGTEFEVDCRGKAKPARVVEVPFYKKA